MESVGEARLLSPLVASAMGQQFAVVPNSSGAATITGNNLRRPIQISAGKSWRTGVGQGLAGSARAAGCSPI
jgi:hypothetical protein